MKQTFTIAQKRVIAACMVIYAAAYLNRLNLAAALEQISRALDITSAQAGLLQTAFAVSYAAGQLINGALVDRLNPVRHMMIGIIGSAVCNLLMGLCQGFLPMLALRFVNGAFQSMLWTPIVRIIALYFSPGHAQEKANIIISLTLIIGHLGAWAISGYLSSVLSWRYSFVVPGALCVPAALCGARLFSGIGAKTDMPTAEKPAPRGKTAGALPLLASSGFFVLLVGCVLFGFVRDGITTWTPTILERYSRGDAVAAVGFSLIIPLVNAGGMYLAYLAQRAQRLRNRRLTALLLAVGACFCLPLTGVKSMLPAALLLGGCCACMAGLEPVLTTLIPLEYSGERLVGLTAGIVDSLIYAGSALAGVCAGAVYGGSGANALFILWATAALLGAVCAFISSVMLARHRAKP